MSEFSLFTFKGFLCLAWVRPVSAKGSPGSHQLNPGMLMSLTSGACDALEKMEVMAVLLNSGFEISIGYMANCSSHDVDWLPYTSS